jgi:phosphohistidine phosphatase
VTRLVLARHAKAVTDGGAGGDHARVLADRGRRDALRLGIRLLEAGWLPDRVVCSDAARTRETWALVSEALHRAGHQPPVTFERRLYLADPDRVVDVARDLGEAGGCLLLVGHNPGWEQLGARLVGQPVHLPTAGTLLLTTPRRGRWSDLLGASGLFSLADRFVP